jgi:hypothetical protein
MLVAYAIPIYYVYYYYYGCNDSVSSILCDQNHKNVILACMALMGVFTIAYELKRNDLFSVAAIGVLLLGIYGLITFDETTNLHYVFATSAFLAIFAFMARAAIVHSDVILLVSLLLCGRLMIDVAVNLQSGNPIIYAEAAYILNFAFFHLYLHCC